MMFRKVSDSYLFVLSALLLASLQACSQPATNQRAGESATTQPTKAPAPQTTFERDLQFIRNGQFTYVWVFSRPDGKPLDKGDAAYLRTKAPQVVDWVITDEGKRAIGGTNFDLELGGLPLLRKRFMVEDYTGE
jgi:phosphate-selective porin